MSKGRTINGIKSVLKKWNGSLTTKDLEMESSPVYQTLGKDHQILIERFYEDEVEVVTYVHGLEVDTNTIPYESLDFDTLDEILNEMETYDIMMDKTMDRIRDEDF